jgi:hypothetical protein
MNIEEPYCAVCRQQIDPASRHVQIEATTKGEDEPEYESYRFHLDCWDSVGSGWGRPG